jgi:putative serine protease PepD
VTSPTPGSDPTPDRSQPEPSQPGSSQPGATWLDDDEWTGGPKRAADRTPPYTRESTTAEPRHDGHGTVEGDRGGDGGAWPAAPGARSDEPAAGWQTWAAPQGGQAPGAVEQAPSWAAQDPSWARSEPWQASSSPWGSTAPAWSEAASPWGPLPAPPDPPQDGSEQGWPQGPPAAGPAVPSPPSRHDDPAEGRGGGRRGGRQVLVAALVSALVAAGVTVPLTLALTDDDGDSQEQASAQQVVLPADPQDDPPADQSPAQTPVQPPAPASGMTSDTIADVAEEVLPSVAVVETFSGSQPIGSGSAVVFRSDGYLVTNNHVVADAGRVQVQLTDGRNLPAEVVGTASTFDLAVLRVEADDLVVPAYAEEDPRVGETAIAIGAPFGFNSTVTSGIVSALGRTLNDPLSGTSLVDLVQTDAAINPGNSGGALVNAAAQVIGINTAIVGGGTNDGVGFAVPTSIVVRVGEQLIDQGFFEYAQLGVQGGDLLPAQAEQLGLETTNGAFIAEVLPGSPADEAGLQGNEVVIAVDGEPLTGMSDLSAEIRNRNPGDDVELEIVGTDGTSRMVEVTLGGVRTND